MGFCSDCVRALLHCAGYSFPYDPGVFYLEFVSGIEIGVILSAEGSATERVRVTLIWPLSLEYVIGCANGRVRGIGRALRIWLDGNGGKGISIIRIVFDQIKKSLLAQHKVTRSRISRLALA